MTHSFLRDADPKRILDIAVKFIQRNSAVSSETEKELAIKSPICTAADEHMEGSVVVHQDAVVVMEFLHGTELESHSGSVVVHLDTNESIVTNLRGLATEDYLGGSEIVCKDAVGGEELLDDSVPSIAVSPIEKGTSLSLEEKAYSMLTCCTFLLSNSNSFKIPNLFSCAVSNKKLMKIIDQLERSQTIKEVTDILMSVEDVFILAGIFKHIVANYSEVWVPPIVRELLLLSASLPSSLVVESLKEIVSLQSLQGLRTIVQFLGKINKHSTKNFTNSHRIAKIFSPCLLPGTESRQESFYVTETLVMNSSALF